MSTSLPTATLPSRHYRLCFVGWQSTAQRSNFPKVLSQSKHSGGGGVEPGLSDPRTQDPGPHDFVSLPGLWVCPLAGLSDGNEGEL